MAHRLIHRLEEAAGAEPHELLLVEAAALRSWAAEAAEAERSACRRIVEEHVRYFFEDHEAAVTAMAEMIAEIDARRGS